MQALVYFKYIKSPQALQLLRGASCSGLFHARPVNREKLATRTKSYHADRDPTQKQCPSAL